MRLKSFWQTLLLLLAFSIVNMMIITQTFAAPTCPINQGPRADAKPNKLYLFFPAQALDRKVDPSVFPPTGFNKVDSWLPLKFDVSDLRNYRGTAQELMDAIHDVVTDIYCEFNVQVIKITRPPSEADGPRRNTIGVGTDAFLRPDCRDPGLGQSVHREGDHTHDETGDHSSDATLVDFGRIWAGSFQSCGTGLGQPLHQATTREWGETIGSSAAHEGGHNYGLAHKDGLPIAGGEDGYYFHLMRAGDSYDLGDRTKARHFSDAEYAILARNVGLAMDTMWDWEFTNPNAKAGVKLRMSFLSTKPQLDIASTIAESNTPWTNPTLSKLPDTTVFRGTTYNCYQIEWASPKTWSGGQPGEVPGHTNFRIGATFSQLSEPDPEAIIITDVTLLDGSDQPLIQHPRWAGHRRAR
jgi:hypothetical protein